MAVSDYPRNRRRDNADTSKTKKEKREEREAERERRKDMNVRKDYGKISKVHFLRRMQYRIIVLQPARRVGNGIAPYRHRTNVTNLVDSVSWSDSGIVGKGSISIQTPYPRAKEDRGSTIRDGNVVKLDAYYGGRWHNVFMMRVQTPSEDVATRAGTFELADDSILLARSEGDFTFVKDEKKHPNPWKANKVTREVCKEWGIKIIGKLPNCEADLTKIEETDVSPIDIIAKVWKQESEESNKKYIISMKHGGLEIRTLRRNANLYSIKEQILSAVVTRDRGEKFITTLRVTGKIKQGKKIKEIDFEVTHGRAEKRYGKVVKHLKLKHTRGSRKVVVDYAKDRLKRSILKKTQPVINLSHVGIPWIRRGDAMEIRLPNYGFKAKQRPLHPFTGGWYNILFLDGIEHSLDSSGHTMDLTFKVEDPVAEQEEAKREAEDKEERKKKRDARGQ